MATKHIPGNVASGRRTPFPVGTFIGELSKVDAAWSEDQKNYNVNLTLENNAPFDDKSPQVGARPKTQRITVVFDEKALVDIEDLNDEKVPFPLRQAGTLVTQLAIALGVAKVNDDGSVDFDMESFLDDLTAGAFNGSTIVFEVRHRAYASRESKDAAKLTGKKPVADRLDDSIGAFAALGQAEEGPVDEPETPPAPEPPPAKPAPATPKSALRGARSR